jgi:transcriptional regulator with XRE-family HTH domain
MSYELLKDNIETLIEKNDYRVSKVEELARLKHGNISNILSGRSKKPSAEILLSIAKVFGVTVEDLFRNKEISPTTHLSSNEISLFLDIVIYLSNKIESLNIKIYYQDLISMINEIFEYSIGNKDYELDKKFIDWYIKQKFTL